MGRFMPKVRAHTAPPKNNEPVSPMNTLAGLKFHRRKPRQPPATAAAIMLKPNMER